MYAFNFDSHGVFTPDGKTEMTPEQAEQYNRELEQAELNAWEQKPARFAVYITKNSAGVWQATTWRGVVLGTVYKRNSFHTNLSRNVVSVRIRGTNGALYYGRYGADWSQLCRVRKFK